MAHTKKLDLPDQFSKHAKALVDAAERGLKSHNAGNVRESGVPLETEFRRLFNLTLPATFQTSSGYFFDNDFQLSAEIDFLLCRQGELLNLPPSQDLDAHYVPYRTVKVMGQLKNSAGDLKKALTQSAKTLKTWQDMANRYPDPERVHPLTIVLIARNGVDAKIRAVLDKSPNELPAYIFFVEAGLLYATSKTVSVLGTNNTYFSHQGNGGPMFLVDAPGKNPRDSGLLFMWLFFALLHHVSPSSTENKTHNRIIENVGNKFIPTYVMPES